MDTITGTYFLENCKILDSSEIQYSFDTSTYFLYEVFRTSSGKLLFFEDHIGRLHEGLKAAGYNTKTDYASLKNCLLSMLQANNNKSGNIKLLCRNNNGEMIFSAYYIPHYYPSPEEYRDGVRTVTYKIERPDPEIKQIAVADKIRSRIESHRILSSAYEVLLVDLNNEITEGSRSNLFFIKQYKLYSAPANKILHGITRKYVMQIADAKGIQVIHEPLAYDSVNSFEAAFICGTSPRILPVKSIDDFRFSALHEITEIIVSEYDKIVEKYLNFG